MRRPILGHEQMMGRLAIPYLTDAGPVTMNFRCIDNHKCKEVDRHSKYKKPPGMPAALYGVQDYFTNKMTLHVTEGELDRLILKHHANLPVMAIPGATNWKRHWKPIFMDFDHVVLWSDGDVAGDGLARKMAKELGQVFKQVSLPEGHDVNSTFLEWGPEFLRGMIPNDCV